MCGRYTASWENASFEKTFNVQAPLFESWNIAPTHFAPIVYQPQGIRETLEARWGLIPGWVRTLADFKAASFNARVEGVSEKPTFKGAFKKRQRCIVPMRGFYEWQQPSKQPYFIEREDSELLACAGLYDHWQQDEEEFYSYTILTTLPNKMMETLHNRMPVILKPEAFDQWLDANVASEDLEVVLGPYKGKLKAHEVSRRVGKVGENDAGLIEPVSKEKA